MEVIFDKDLEFKTPYALLHLYTSSCKLPHTFHRYISLFYQEACSKKLEEILERVNEVVLNPKKRTYVYKWRLALNEEKARELTNYLEQNIRDSTGFVRLNDIRESGLMFFDRMVLFRGWKRNQRSQLLELIKSSGYNPHDHDSQGWYDAKLATLRNPPCIPDSDWDFSKEYAKATGEYESKKVDSKTADKIWEKSLSFFE